jgi:hypothetical protein
MYNTKNIIKIKTTSTTTTSTTPPQYRSLLASFAVNNVNSDVIIRQMGGFVTALGQALDREHRIQLDRWVVQCA